MRGRESGGMDEYCERLFIKDRRDLSPCFRCKGRPKKTRKGKMDNGPKEKERGKRTTAQKDKKGEKGQSSVIWGAQHLSPGPKHQLILKCFLTIIVVFFFSSSNSTVSTELQIHYSTIISEHNTPSSPQYTIKAVQLFSCTVVLL